MTSTLAPATSVRRAPADIGVRTVVGLLTVLLMLLGLPSQAQAAANPAEQQFLQLVNQERASRGLATLQLSPVVSDTISRPWSAHMAATNRLAHSGSGMDIFNAVARAYPGTSTVGENVGYASSVGELHSALMASPGHRANILSTSFRYVGLGVVVSGSRTWVTQTFFTTSDVVAAEVAAPSAADVAATQRWVGALYQDFLGRQAETSGRDFWADHVLQGRMTRQQVAYTMATTEEWLNRLVNDMYVRTLGRPADAGGLVFWRNQLRSGMPVAEVAARFYASQEYYLRLGARDDVWVRDLYKALLERDAEASGLQFWAERAQTHGRLSVAYQFYNSPENNMRRVNSLYGSLLSRTADSAGMATWPAVVGTQGDLSLAAFLASSHEYWLRAQTR